MFKKKKITKKKLQVDTKIQDKNIVSKQIKDTNDTIKQKLNKDQNTKNINSTTVSSDINTSVKKIISKNKSKKNTKIAYIVIATIFLVSIFRIVIPKALNNFDIKVSTIVQIPSIGVKNIGQLPSLNIKNIISYLNNSITDSGDKTTNKDGKIIPKQKSIEEIVDAIKIKKTDRKTNILIIGRDADGFLTDSIMLASLDYMKKSVSMFSIPRDLWAQYPTGGSGKINGAFWEGYRLDNTTKSGVDNLSTIIKDITGQDIHYFINLDFNGFIKVIDTIGGIDIDVPNTIYDPSYPDAHGWYDPFYIEAGLRHLDGTTSLKYARTRHTTSDFDRSLRQQAIIKAVRDKLLSTGVITSPTKIKGIYETINEYIQTDFDISEIISMSLYFRDIDRDDIISSNLSEDPIVYSVKGGYLFPGIRANFGGQAVMLQDGWTSYTPSDYSKIRPYVNMVFNYPLIYKENLKVNILNSTTTPGIAGSIATSLTKLGFNIPTYNSTGNTDNRENFEQTTIYFIVDDGIGVDKVIDNDIIQGDDTIDGHDDTESDLQDLDEAQDLDEDETQDLDKIIEVELEDKDIPETLKALESITSAQIIGVRSLPMEHIDEDVKIQIILGNDYEKINL